MDILIKHINEIPKDIKKTLIGLRALSNCKKAQVATVLTKGQKIVATGYNYNPNGDCEDKTNKTLPTTIHAEEAALRKVKESFDTIYVYGKTPCISCLKLIIASSAHFLIIVED